ncbi:unnamed protein product [Arabidopsis halleri]
MIPFPINLNLNLTYNNHVCISFELMDRIHTWIFFHLFTTLVNPSSCFLFIGVVPIPITNLSFKPCYFLCACEAYFRIELGRTC